MGLFGKKGDDVIDFTYRQKRGVLKKKEAGADVNSPEVVDLRPSVVESEASAVASEGFPDLGFLSNLAESAEPNTGETEMNKGTPVPVFKDDTDLMMNEMRIRMEDNEYKIEMLEDKIKELERKLKG
jgi:hypothetical protein